ncbi:MAG: heme biosynthesis protein HemY [Gammaproteobacteria bacterium]|nr:heme biosynthesis protein HemY [Gammaproteobacteria bacterium]MCP5136338.1 heme biosynthesis protein HemY [Gammaproteobacteria bacterium]
MKLLLVALLTTLGAVSLALIVREDPGYILIGYGDWTVEMALTLFALFLIAAFALGYVLLRTLIRLWQIPAQTRAWNARRRLQASRRGLALGLLELTQERWSEAEKRLVRSARHSDAAILNFLGAARAAQHLGAEERRDDYLSQAANVMPNNLPGAEVALGVTRAELQMASEQWQQASATLADLRERNPKHRHVLALSANVLHQSQDWDALNALLPALRRHKALPEAALQALTTEVRLIQLDKHASGAREAFEAYWLSIPKSERLTQPLLGRYLELLPSDAADRGLELIRDAQKHGWDGALARRYTRLRGSNPNQQFQHAESWLHGRENDADLLLNLGQMAQRAQLWGKARSYLETSLSLRPDAEAYRVLGEVLLEIGDSEAAARRFRQGLDLATGSKPSPSGAAVTRVQTLSRVNAA